MHKREKKILEGAHYKRMEYNRQQTRLLSRWKECWIPKGSVGGIRKNRHTDKTAKNIESSCCEEKL